MELPNIVQCPLTTKDIGRRDTTEFRLFGHTLYLIVSSQTIEFAIEITQLVQNMLFDPSKVLISGEFLGSYTEFTDAKCACSSRSGYCRFVALSW